MTEELDRIDKIRVQVKELLLPFTQNTPGNRPEYFFAAIGAAFKKIKEANDFYITELKVVIKPDDLLVTLDGTYGMPDENWEYDGVYEMCLQIYNLIAMYSHQSLFISGVHIKRGEDIWIGFAEHPNKRVTCYDLNKITSPLYNKDEKFNL